jgi:hypothetical protein
LNKAFYLTAESDVGGFGIGSDIAVQEYAALGCQITRNIFSEIGYRYLYDDFHDTIFLYQLSLHGAQITVGLKFPEIASYELRRAQSRGEPEELGRSPEPAALVVTKRSAL